MFYQDPFDVIIIGGGHAGTEAAMAAARMGQQTLLLTHNIDTLGQMSCNPAIGGIGKGHLVKEVDALGGLMAKAIDHAGIQFRILNASKGPAVRATRAQADRVLYRQAVRTALENQPNLMIFQQAVEDLIVENDRVVGAVTQMGLKFRAKAVVLTVGTFLDGKIHIGLDNYSGGRAGDPPSIPLSRRLRELPLRVSRLKTGTPPRIDARTIDFSVLGQQNSDNPMPVFSFLGDASQHPRQMPCYITHTNEKTHEIIRNNLHRAPMYTGVVEGVGPRYCPSIESKIVRFSEKPSHQLFIEPEGLHTNEMYVQGMSTSLPIDVQYEFLRTIAGMENVKIMRPGYAIDYDCFDPTQLKPSLEFKAIHGLFSAGQANGTSGYEEAAAQGLIAGINAVRLVQSKEPFILSRSDAYIGVLIDDLVTKGTQEPYRIMTSRAEYRLLLRQDNADLRLTEKGREIGLVTDERYARFTAKQQAIADALECLRGQMLTPTPETQEKMRALATAELRTGVTLYDLLRRTEIDYAGLCQHFELPALSKEVQEQVEIAIKYDGYIQKQVEQVERAARLEAKRIPEDVDYHQLGGLAVEAREKLSEIKPLSVGQASRISGVSPADIAILMVYLEQRQRGEQAREL